jgi:diguanylate cyclase (GGDEF)-like protein/PAS domain S-box-containing protein
MYWRSGKWLIMLSGFVVALSLLDTITKVEHVWYLPELAVMLLSLVAIGLLALERQKHQQSESRFRALVETSPDGIIEVDENGTILYCNASYLQLVGAEQPEQVIGQKVMRFLHPDYHPVVGSRIQSLDQMAQIPFIEEKYVRLDGTVVPVEVGAARTTTNPPKLMAIVRDISRHKQAEEALRASEARFRALVQNSYDVTLIVNVLGDVLYASPNAPRLRLRKMHGDKPNIFHYLSAEDAARCKHLLDRLIFNPGEIIQTEVCAPLERGGMGWFEIWGQNQVADPAVGGIVLNIRDISERKAYQSTIEHLAYHDPLTGLPNRRMLREQADQFLAHSQRGGREATLIYLDLDHFKEVNDTLGHEAGDELLVQVARRIQNCVRSGDLLARLGGDEFAILLGETTLEGATDAARRVLAVLQQPFTVADTTLRIGASLGLGVYPRDGQNLDDLMRVADVAMYRAKEHGTGLMFYSPDLDRYSRERLNLIQDLREALYKGEIYLEYQPILDTHSERWIKVEALARWKHPSQGLISPASFIPLAEETGLIRDLDHLVLDKACHEASLLGLSIAVNISPRTLYDSSFVEVVAAVLHKSGLEPENLHLEITETALIQNLPRAVQHLSALRQLGVRVALDDFGVGHTSMSYLKDLPIDLLKIDRSFIHGIGRDSKEEAILRTILLLGEGLGLRTVAEGVETPEQIAWLQERGCHLLQGFGIARPQSKEGLINWREPVLRGRT